VHARALVVSLRCVTGLPVREIERGLDALLPPDIGVRSLREAAPGFHAQRDALWKWYRYRVLVSRRKRPLRPRTWRLARVPTLEALRQAAAPLVGRHDFASFANSGSSPGPSTVRRVFHARWSQSAPELHFDIVGDGFLYKMVRTIVGTCLSLAAQDEPCAAMTALLAACDRRQAGRAAPAQGLCLMAVAMKGESIPGRVPRALRPVVESGSHATPGGHP
jgi:tRNA pseudouridine38-40 synthase